MILTLQMTPIKFSNFQFTIRQMQTKLKVFKICKQNQIDFTFSTNFKQWNCEFHCLIPTAQLFRNENKTENKNGILNKKTNSKSLVRKNTRAKRKNNSIFFKKYCHIFEIKSAINWHGKNLIFYSIKCFENIFCKKLIARKNNFKI